MTNIDSRVVVVGGGITGLTTALTLFHQDVDVVIVEAADRVGGKILTSHVQGVAIDAGADAFLVRQPHMTELCDQLNLTADLVAPATGAAKVWWRGALRPLPNKQYLGVPLDLEDLESTGLFSPEGASRARADLTDPANAPAGDESVGSLIRRRLGDEVMDRLVAPLIGGINAGDADRLSLQGGVPQLAAAATHDPSLTRSIAAHLQQAQRKPSDPIFLGHPNGLGQIVDALETRLRGRIHLNTPVRGLARHGSRWRIEAENTFDADAVVITTPSFATAEIVRNTSARAATMLDRLEYASVAMVTFAFAASDVERFEGSGFLIPRGENLVMSACSWASSKWAHLGEGPTEYLRVSAGHAGDTRPVSMTDSELVDKLLGELKWVVGLSAEPQDVRVTRWPNSFPQYRPGHLDWAAGVDSALAKDAPGVFVAGAAYRGLGLPACVHQGRRAAYDTIAYLAEPAGE